MQAAAALSGGSVVTLGQTSSLADALIQIDNQRLKRERASKKLTVAAKVRQFLSSVTAANLLLLILVLACGIDWSLRAARQVTVFHPSRKDASDRHVPYTILICPCSLSHSIS